MIVLDTHALVWWVSDPERIPAKARREIGRTVKGGDAVVVSSISVWEVTMLVARGRLQLTVDVETWIAHVEALPFVQFVPVDNRVAIRAVRLEGFRHRDPADRMIVATALGLGATLVTADERLQAYHPVKTLWA
ncbi:MAG: type II toxin-antitoxin system VapC family toxin [Gemmatimonadetes bacterium]|nr:type II toxin-antitoxin system VapC family toxin [Gemmatimonadota bacterium]MBI2536219.1 type II toxin-antitoxin system VapC family toxin [Gemmatimonadota bacterium]MBI3082575.1 type II toxin-antitoxin system VapC family toxin [Gemmatimonadota bacterium]